MQLFPLDGFLLGQVASKGNLMLQLEATLLLQQQ
jgi:hypothetical protein